MHMVLHRGLYFPQTYFFRVLTYGAENHLAPKPRSHMKSTRPITWTAAGATVLRRSQSPDKSRYRASGFDPISPVRQRLPAQPVDGTPSSALIRPCLRGRGTCFA